MVWIGSTLAMTFFNIILTEEVLFQRAGYVDVMHTYCLHTMQSISASRVIYSNSFEFTSCWKVQHGLAVGFKTPSVVLPRKLTLQWSLKYSKVTCLVMSNTQIHIYMSKTKNKKKFQYFTKSETKASCGEINKGKDDCQSNNFWQIKKYPKQKLHGFTSTWSIHYCWLSEWMHQ